MYALHAGIPFLGARWSRDFNNVGVGHLPQYGLLCMKRVEVKGQISASMELTGRCFVELSAVAVVVSLLKLKYSSTVHLFIVYMQAPT